MNKFTGHISGALLAIGLMVALQCQSDALPVNIKTPVTKLRQVSPDPSEILSGFKQLVRLKVGESDYCTGLLLAPTIVATASDCIDPVVSAYKIVVEPSSYRSEDWSIRGLRVCTGRGDLAGKVSFLKLEEAISAADLFGSVITGSVNQTAGIILGFGSQDPEDQHGSVKPVTIEECPPHYETSDNLCATIRDICPADLGAPILVPRYDTNQFQLIGFVSNIIGDMEDDACQLAARVRFLNLMVDEYEDQLAKQSEECEL